MTSKAALLALLTVWGVGAAVPHQAWADETTTSEHATEDEDAPLSSLAISPTASGLRLAMPPRCPAPSRFSSRTARSCRIRCGKRTACRPGR